jgi:putative tricarboxylic transport membrane protein
MGLIEYPILIGLATGVIGGLLPGIGHLLCLIFLFPLMINWSAVEIFICFAIMVQVSQFLGSLTTIFTRVPGELSSLPMVEELKNVPENRLSEVVSSTAVGSLTGMIIAIGICYFLLDWLHWFSFFFRTEIMLVLMLAAIAMIFYHSRGSWMSKIFVSMLGATLGLVGYNQTLEVNILTMGSTSLMMGIPITVVLVCLFAFPQLYQIRNLMLTWKPEKIKFSLPYSVFKVMPVSSVIGFIGGMMPGLATLFSSQLAYNWAKTRTNDPVQKIVASETANNAGAIGQMIPMLILGLPILSSEALVLGLMESQGYTASLATGTSYMFQTLIPLIVTAVIAVILAWPLAMFTIKILNIDIRILRVVSLLFLCAVIFYQAYVDYQMMFVFLCFLAMSMLGWLLKNQDTSLLIFLFFVSERLLEHSMRIVSLYF